MDKRPDTKPGVDRNIAMLPGKRRALDMNQKANRLIDELEKSKASDPKWCSHSA